MAMGVYKRLAYNALVPKRDDDKRVSACTQHGFDNRALSSSELTDSASALWLFCSHGIQSQPFFTSPHYFQARAVWSRLVSVIRTLLAWGQHKKLNNSLRKLRQHICA